MRSLSLIYAYYNNPLMFLRQLQEWENYPDEIKEKLKIYITDDCSEISPLSKILRFPEKIEGHAYRITTKVQWNWIACRNIGAYHCDTGWLLVTDIDHMVSKKSIEKLMSLLDFLDPRLFYFFTRENLKGEQIKMHSNSYLMTHEMYWKIGGFDEQLSGLFFGTTACYRRRALAVVANPPTLSIPLTTFVAEDIIDANCFDTFDRNKERDESRLAKIMKKKEPVRVLSFPYIEL